MLSFLDSNYFLASSAGRLVTATFMPTYDGLGFLMESSLKFSNPGIRKEIASTILSLVEI